MIENLFFILLGYLLGSLPFGYIITKLSTGKNILEIGWRKTSGSNVFRNVGFWQGFLTGILDLAKGALAVFLAQKFGLSPQTQALSGLAAILGHNWSLFLRFAGGRGIATFIGAFLILSPKILGLSLLILVFFAIFWNSSIGTIFFLISSIVFAQYLGGLATIGYFPLLCILPIFIKRLSPIKEISLKNKELIRNRLIFDNDQFCSEWRIKKIIKNLTKK
jgi:glycerol-3-phosphate acyltransferase PlsY